jgi:hypothetical protein
LIKPSKIKRLERTPNDFTPLPSAAMNRARGGADEKTIEDKSPMRATIQRTAAIGMNPAASIETGYQGPTTIYCQSTGSEGFLRRAVKKMGWSEVPPSVNMFKESNFHIRFSISDWRAQPMTLGKIIFITTIRTIGK